MGHGFEVRAGLSPRAVPGVPGRPIALDPAGAAELTLRVTVGADGFVLAAGAESRDLLVTGEDLYPVATFRLEAQDHEMAVRAGTIEFTFLLGDGQVGEAMVVVLSRARMREKRP